MLTSNLRSHAQATTSLVDEVDVEAQNESDPGKCIEGVLWWPMLVHELSEMCHTCCDQEGWKHEGCNCRGGDVLVDVGDILQHGEPEERISEAENSASNDGVPVGNLSAAGVSEPEETKGDQPDGAE